MLIKDVPPGTYTLRIIDVREKKGKMVFDAMAICPTCKSKLGTLNGISTGMPATPIRGGKHGRKAKGAGLLRKKARKARH